MPRKLTATIPQLAPQPNAIGADLSTAGHSRKGARTTAAVPNEVRRLLHAGLIESVNLCEWLIVDHAELARTVFTDFRWGQLISPAVWALSLIKSPTALKRTIAVGTVLAESLQKPAEFHNALAFRPTLIANLEPAIKLLMPRDVFRGVRSFRIR